MRISATGLCIALALLATVSAVQAGDAEAIKQGEYLARAGDCMACHTQRGGKPYAGGLPLETPIGAVYATNITPDKEYGIGQYSLDEFSKAVRQGVRRDGSSLYPAMPFPSYAKVTDEDIAKLYAYFMHGVEPVHEQNRESGIPWPMNMRWPLAIWRWTFAPALTNHEGTTTAAQDQVIQRGEYLVTGLGHCGSCHTPRGVGMQEKALSADESDGFLAGGAPLEGWVAKNLRGDTADGLGNWSEEQLARFFKTGRTEKTAAFGSMTDVVQHSLQYLTDADRIAIARYLKTLSPTRDSLAAGDGASERTSQALRQMDVSTPGARTYVDNCMACHRSDGKGYAEVFPALAGNSVINGKDATSLIHIVLDGGYLPGNQHAPTAFAMPGFHWRLSDQEVADVVTFIRQGWGNSGDAISLKEVAEQRKK